MQMSARTARRRWSLAVAVAGAFALQAPLAYAQGHITSPKEQFGFNIGDDYKLATYTQFEQYWRKIAAQSNRAKLQEIGKTAEGRPQLMMIISSPANLARLDRYRRRFTAIPDALTNAVRWLAIRPSSTRSTMAPRPSTLLCLPASPSRTC